MKNSPVTIISLSESHVSLSHTKPHKGSLAISYLSMIEKGNLQTDEAARFISESLSKQKIVPERVLTVIPRRLIMLKSLVLPAVKDEELQRMLNLQIAQQVPYSKEDIIYDFISIDKVKEGYTQILAVIIQRETIQKFIDIIHKAKLQCQNYIPSSWGVWAWYSNQKSSQEAGSRVCAVFDVQSRFSEIVFCTKEKVLFSRNINYGSTDLVKEGGVNEKILAAFLKELGLTVGAYYNSKIGPVLKKAVVLTASENITFLAGKIEEALNVTTDTVNPFDATPVTKDCDVSNLKGKDSLSLTPHLGLSLYDAILPVNLTPKLLLDTKRDRLRRGIFMRFAAAFAAVFCLSISALWSHHFHREKYLKEVEVQIQQIQKKSQAAERKIDSLRFLKNKVQNKIFVADIIENLIALTPQEITFSLLDINGKGEMIIQGATEEGGSVNLFQSQLVNSPLFIEVNLQYATKRRRFRAEYTDFKIICKLAEAGSF